jgi:hypothetical protein
MGLVVSAPETIPVWNERKAMRTSKDPLSPGGDKAANPHEDNDRMLTTCKGIDPILSIYHHIHHLMEAPAVGQLCPVEMFFIAVCVRLNDHCLLLLGDIN